MIDLPFLLQCLASRRPVFHSEADFQHELAWEIRVQFPEIGVRLERPLDEFFGATDLVLFEGRAAFGVELKFCSRATRLDCLEEVFRLKQHGAHPLRRYDICKDVQRMESFNARHQHGSAVIVLTNDSAYWKGNGRANVCDDAFRISESRTLQGHLDWGANASAGTRRKRESPIDLVGSYNLKWKPYSEVDGKRGQFQYLLISIR